MARIIDYLDFVFLILIILCGIGSIENAEGPINPSKSVTRSGNTKATNRYGTSNTATRESHRRNNVRPTSRKKPTTTVPRKSVIRLIDCPKGDDVSDKYIKVKTNASCTCATSDRSLDLQWYDETNGRFIGSSTKMTSILQIHSDAKETKKTFSCRYQGISPAEEALRYIPKFAYGPTHISIVSSSQSRQINMCELSRHYYLLCEVRPEWYHPNVTVKVEFDGNMVKAVREERLGGVRRFYFPIPIRRGGNFTLNCIGYNSVFEEIYANKTTVWIIKEPPSAPPNLTINDRGPRNYYHSMTAGQSMKFKCEVRGGYPQVEEIYLTTIYQNMSKHSRKQRGNQFSFTFEVKKDMDKAVIKCSAFHISGCYYKTTSVKLDVQYEAAITMFKISNTSHQLSGMSKTKVEVDVGSSLVIECAASGNPKPDTMSIQYELGQDISQNLLASSKSEISISKKTIFCNDTGRYICKASNGIGSPARKEVVISVKCPLEFSDDDEKRIINTTNGADINVAFNILGYPRPLGSKLHKISSLSNDNGETKSSLDTERYSVDFSEIDELTSQVNLTMYKMGNEDSGQYTLDVQNGIGRSLKFTFEITIKNEKSEGGTSTFLKGMVSGIVLSVIFIIVIAVILVIVMKKHINKKDLSTSHGTGDYKGTTMTNEIYGARPDAYDKQGITMTNEIYGARPDGDADDKQVTINNTIYGMNNNSASRNGRLNTYDQHEFSVEKQIPINENEYAEIDTNHTIEDSSYSTLP